MYIYIYIYIYSYIYIYIYTHICINYNTLYLLLCYVVVSYTSILAAHGRLPPRGCTFG